MRLRHLTPLAGGLLLAPFLVVIPLDATVASPTPSPVSGAQAEAAMLDATRPEAVTAAALSATEIATARRSLAAESLGTQSLPRSLAVLKATAPQSVNERLAAVAVTWAAGSGRGVAVQVRSKRAGTWGAWEDVEVNASTGPDRSREGNARQGSELYMVSGATEVQGRVLGTPTAAPLDAKLTVIDPGESDADAVVGAAQSGAAQAVTPRPNIYTRAQWGADESWRTGTPENNVPRGIVLHHTADTNNYTADMVPGMLRSMYRYATKTLGWDDIAYNFIIDRWGRIWQGRAWLYPEQPVFPAAQLSNNDRGVGVSMLGNYQGEVLSTAARSSLVKLLAWKSSLHGIDPLGTTTWYDNKTSKYITLPTINGHKDTYFTLCPGVNLYPLIPSIRRQVADLVGSNPFVSRTGAFRDFDGMADADVLGRDAAGRLTLASPDGAGDMTGMEIIGGTGWSAFDHVSVAGDWNGDGSQDLLARHAATGGMWLYAGNGKGGFLGAKRIGVGWNSVGTLVAPGDWNGDGRPDVLATNKQSGAMYLYPGNGRGGFTGRAIAVGRGWRGMRSLAGIGDWNDDGKADLLAVTAKGVGVVYTGSGRGTFAGQTVQDGNWQGYATLTGVMNANGDNKPAVLGVDAAGNTYLGSAKSRSEVAWTKAARSYRGFAVYGG